MKKGYMGALLLAAFTLAAVFAYVGYSVECGRDYSNSHCDTVGPQWRNEELLDPNCGGRCDGQPGSYYSDRGDYGDPYECRYSSDCCIYKRSECATDPSCWWLGPECQTCYEIGDWTPKYSCVYVGCPAGTTYTETGDWTYMTRCTPEPCNPTFRTCNYNGVFQHYSNCNGEQIIDDCVDEFGSGAYCENGACQPARDPCFGVSCNSPPASYCSGDTAVGYNSPGSCSGGSCSYSQWSYDCNSQNYWSSGGSSTTCSGSNVVRVDTNYYHDYGCSGGNCYEASSTASSTSTVIQSCPTSGCASGDTAYTGGCSGSSCYQNNQYCGGDGWACSGDTKYYRDNYCSGGCTGSDSQHYDCNSLNGWVNIGYRTECRPDNQVYGVLTNAYYDYGCGSGNCYLADTSQRSESAAPIENCGAKNGWYDATGCYGDCDGATPITKKNQEYRSYYCSNSRCDTYTVTSTRTAECSRGSACPTSGCADPKTYYSGGCSGGSCYTNNQPCGDNGWACQDSETRAYSSGYCTGSGCGQQWTQQQNCNNNNRCDPAGTSKFCSGSQSCVRTSYNYVDYGCSGGSCSEASRYPSGSCPPSDSCSACSFGCDSSTGECSTCSPCTADGWFDSGSSYACCSDGGTRATCQNQEYRDYTNCAPCSYSVTNTRVVTSNPVACNSPPGGSCSGNTRVYYSSPGTCSAGTCSYTQQTQNCPTTGCSGDTVQTGGCSSGSCYMNNGENCNSRDNCANSGAVQRVCRDSGSACDAQNRILNDYTCSSGGCVLGSSGPSGTCPTQYSNCITCTTSEDACLDASTLRDYATSTCSSGQCSNNHADVTCQFGCKTQAGHDVCHADACNPNPCTNTLDDVCVSSSTLQTYPSSGSCANSGTGGAVCTYTPAQQSCQYGCLSLSGDDRCASNSAPTLSGLTLSGSYLSYARNGHMVAVSSTGSDPNSEQVRLRCGTSSGATDLCTSGYASANPSCSFSNAYSDSSDHTVYCFLEDTPGARSSVLTATLSADNSGPTVTVSRTPSGSITPGTSVTLTTTASDSRSGVATMHVVVDGYTAATCSSTTCAYTFLPSYGNHSYYANAYDRLGNAAWAYDTFNYPGPGPNGNGTAPPPGTEPGEGTTPLPTPSSPAPGSPGTPCSSNDNCNSGICDITEHCYGTGTSPPDSPCSSNSQCASGVCDNTEHCYGGTFPGSPTGSNPYESPCSSGGACQSGICDTTDRCHGGPNPGGSPCSSNSQCASGACDITGRCAPPPPSPSPLPVNNPPVVAGPITYSGACVEGGTITLRCSASDPNQASNSLTAKVWAGECSGANCFATRSWTYANGGAMSHQSGDRFTRDITITSRDGTAIAATCQVSDAFGATSNWGDAYPLCVVNQCQNPPIVTVESITPNPSGPGEVQVAFSLDRSGQGEPSVRVKPGSQRGGTNEITANQVSKQGNRYVYKFTAQQSALSGIADVAITGSFTDNKGANCQYGQISQMTIDTDSPVTTVLCNGAPCSGTYTGTVSMVLSCSDGTTSCNSTKFGIGAEAQPLEEYSVPRVVDPQRTGLNVVTINYQSTDTVGNVEQTKSQQIRIYLPPCRVPSEEPACLGGRIEEEVRMKAVLDRVSILKGSTLNARIYCFVRNKDTKVKTRECLLDPASINVIIDRGTVRQKDYFSYYYEGYDYPRNTPTPYDSSRKIAYLNERQNTSSHSSPIDSIQYTFGKSWTLPIYTSVFQSEVCVNGTDQGSGQSGQDCGNYTVTNSELFLDVSFPDLGVIVPRTTDGQNEANFTRTMLINFEAVPSVSTVLVSSPCTGVDCRVDFNFDGGAWKQTTWSDFEKAYVPSLVDVASNSFPCDQYRTLHVKAVKQGGQDSGIETTVQKRFFVSCDSRIYASPSEVRLVLNDAPGKVFELTAINPTEAEKVFVVQSTSTNPSGYPLPWIRFLCESIGCEAGPGTGLPDDDYARLTIPAGLSRSVTVNMATAAKSGSFPVTFVATEGANTYTSTATLLIFAEGLSEFAAWQLVVLVLIVLAVLYYSGFYTKGAKPKGRRKK